jgi:hypothetical protein
LFFEKYAKEVGFDPEIPSNWYSQPRENILAAKVFLTLKKKGRERKGVRESPQKYAQIF